MPRTEQEILKDFEKLGWEISNSYDSMIVFSRFGNYDFVINKKYKEYFSCKDSSIAMQEHKLLNELFTIWGWLDD